MTVSCVLAVYVLAALALALWGRRELAQEWRESQGVDRLITAVSVVGGPIIVLGLCCAAVLFDRMGRG